MHLILLFLLLLLPSQLWGYTETFYVKVGGDGSAPETLAGAYDCSAAGNAYSVNNTSNWDTDDADDGKIGLNDAVLFYDDGGVFTVALKPPSSGTSGNPVTLKAGSGESPTWRGCTVCDGAGNDWVDAENPGDDIWEYSLAGSVPAFIVLDTTWTPMQANFAALDAQGEFYYCDGCGDGTDDVLYMFSTTDPDTLHPNEICAPQVQWGIYSYEQNYIDYQGFTTWGFNDAGLLVFARDEGPDSSYVTFTDCTTYLNYNSGAWAGTLNTPDVEKVEYVTWTNITSYNNGTCGFQTNSDTENITVSKCIAYDNGQQETTAGIGVRIVGDINTIESCIVYDNYYGGVVLTNTSTTNTVRYNRIYSNGRSGITVSGGTGNNIYYNLVYENDRYGAYIDVDANFYNNVFYNNCVTDNVDEVTDSNGGETVNFKNNIVYNDFSGNCAFLWDVRDGTNITFANNLYWEGTASETNRVDYEGTSYDLNDEFSDWETASGESNAPTPADPKFIDAANANFQLQHDSPAINVGTDVSLARDQLSRKVPYGSAQDIGALEYSLAAKRRWWRFW